MLRTPFLRSIALLLALALAAAACSSSSDADSTTSDGDADTEDVGTEDVGTDSTIAPVSLDGPIDPEGVRQLANSLTGTEVGGEVLTCLLDRADGDSQVTAMFNGSQTQGYQFTPEAYTALAVSLHGCMSADVLAASLLALSGGVESELQDAYSACVTEQIGAEQTGDLAYTGLSAIQVGFPVPEGAQEQAILAASTCIAPESLAGQLAAAREQASGFTVEVDRDCVVGGIDESFTQTFWEGAVTGSDSSATLQPLVEDCTSEYDSGLPSEIPADFVAFAGSGELSGIDPASRNSVYSEAPPMSLEPGVDYQVQFTTENGDILVDLYEETAPITVNAFVSLARDGYYDGTRFHRVLDGFMAQGGDPTGTGSGGPGYSFEDEESGLTPIDRRGLLAMANSGPDTNGSQFFITLGEADWLDGLHTVFGEVIEGDEVLGSITLRDPAAPTSRGDEVTSVTILEG
jgi:cyclophilin family peptidyl-prolyl cis-trans isomerase